MNRQEKVKQFVKKCLTNCKPPRCRVPDVEYRRIGARIKAAREAAGLSQKELGERVGVTDSAVTHWEKGTNGVGVVELKHIARILKRPLDYFTDGMEVSQLPSEQLRMAAHEQLAALARDEHIPPGLLDWITEVLDDVLTRIEKGETKRSSNL